MGAEDQLFHRFGKEFPAGTVLFREGEAGKEMYVIQSGRVSIKKRVRDVEKLLVTLGPGEFLGEMAIISSKPRTATARVEEDARLLVIDLRTFEAMIRGNAEIAVRMIKKLADRLAEADAQIENLLLRDASSRVVHHLGQLAARGNRTPAGVEVKLNLEDLPGVLGIRPGQLGDVLAKIEKTGIAARRPDGLLIPEPAKLDELLRFLEMKEQFGEI